jgi:hypothetical protein
MSRAPLVDMMLIRSCMIGSGGVHRSIQGLFCLADGWAAGGVALYLSLHQQHCFIGR